MTVAGHEGQAPVVQVEGKSYVEVESLARITNSSLSFKGNQITLTFSGVGTEPAEQPPTAIFSKDFLRAGIEALSVIREWRIAIVNAVQNNFPVAEEWVAGYRRTAESKLALASAAATKDSDRSGALLLTAEFNKMQSLSDKYVQLHKNLTYTAPDSFDQDPQDQQVLSCARGLAALAAGGRYEDVPACH